MEKIITTTKLDFRTLKYCNLFLMKFQRKSKLWIIITVLLSAGIIVYDLVVLKVNLFAILGGVFILYSLYKFFTLEKALDQQLAGFFRGRPVTTQNVEVDDEEIKVIRSFDPENPIVYNWSYVTQIYQMPQYYMLMVGKGSPVIIDRSPEAVVSGSQEALDQIVLEKSKMKPYKKTDEDLVKIPITYVHEVFPTANAVEVENEVAPADEQVQEGEVVSEEPENKEEPAADNSETGEEDNKQ
ncbi:MAG: hypothetical protein GX661_06445 [Acholeplasmataceae bacterium]|nr:hypothetical protein [Acholeplasmataceae bacterium]